jgi:NAD(P)-dependent dehydrogenase (short-subunit alcohol dehydrogenase family)
MPHRSTVVITGASAGVGRATVGAFARRGWNVALLARGTAGLEAAKAEAERLGAGAALALPVDVVDAEAMFLAADQAAEVFGGIDVWVNCAMATVLGEVAETTPEEFRRVTDVTYLGYVHGTMAALRHMRPRDRGTIVQVGSALAYRAIPLQAAYCGAKFAIRGFTDSLRSELIHAGSGIRLTMVQLPAVNTPQFDWARNHMDRRPRPVAPVFTPEAVAKHIFRAALDAPRELWVGGPAVQAILGGMVVPGLLDRMLASKAYDGQQSPEPARRQPDNLFTAVPGDRGAHGRFGSEARGSVGAYGPAALRAAAAMAGLGLLGCSWLLGRAAGAARGKPRRSRHIWWGR